MNAPQIARAPASLGIFLTGLACCIAPLPALLLPSFDDLFWQIAEGREVLAGHIPTTVPSAISAGPWIDHEWLFEAFAAAAYDHHSYWLLVAVCAVIGALIPLIIFASVRNVEVNDLGAGLAALVSSLVMFKYDAIRPLQFGVLACSITFLLLRKRVINPWWYFLLAVVWANFHASVVLGPVICTFFVIDAWHAGKHHEARRYGMSAGFMLLGSLCTPSSFTLYSYAVSHLGFSGNSTQYIAEWDPFSFHNLLDWISIGAIFVAVAAAWPRKDIPLAERIAAITFVLFELHQQRQSAFLTVSCAGLIARSLPRLSAHSIRWTFFEPLMLGLLIATLVYDAPLAARADALQLNPDVPKMFANIPTYAHPLNAYIDYDIAGYAELVHAPFRLLIDSHADCFSSRTIQDWLTLLHLAPDWQDVLKRNHIQLVIVLKKAPIAQALVLLPGWKVLATQGDYIVFFDAALTPSFANSSVTLSTSAISARNSDARSLARAAISR